MRVPVEGETMAEAKRALAADLAAQFRLLSLLSSSHNQLAPQLRENLAYLLSVWTRAPAFPAEKKGTRKAGGRESALHPYRVVGNGDDSPMDWCAGLIAPSEGCGE